jgi:hypothetical protein
MTVPLRRAAARSARAAGDCAVLGAVSATEVWPVIVRPAGIAGLQSGELTVTRFETRAL